MQQHIHVQCNITLATNLPAWFDKAAPTTARMQRENYTSQQIQFPPRYTADCGLARECAPHLRHDDHGADRL